MWSLTVLFFLNLSKLYFVWCEDFGSRTKDESKKIVFPSEPYPLYSRHSCSSCNNYNHDQPPPSYHNNEGYLPPNYQNNRRNPFPAGFKHNPEFHQRHFGEQEGKNVRFNEEAESSTSEAAEFKNETLKLIPLEYLETFDNMSVKDILSNYIEGYEAGNTKFFANRFGDEDGDEIQGRNAVKIIENAKCMPENTTVVLSDSNDSSIIYIPKCTRIERCGGCCPHELLSCQPVETEILSVQVVTAQYIGGKKLKYRSKDIIPLERHTKCKCSCRIKAEHCQSNQEYKENQCRCACKNKDEERKCYNESNKKEWDSDSCLCKCKTVMECSTGSVYDQNECRCKIAPKRRFAKLDRRKGYVTENLFITPLEI